MPETICASPMVRGPRKGQTATGTTGGWHRHKRAGEVPCEPCAEAYRADSRQRRADNPQYLERARELRAANPEPRRLADKKYRDANPEKARARQVRWRENNPERYKQRNREAIRKWMANNPEKVAERYPEYNRRWRQANPDRIAEWQRARRSRIASNTVTEFTADQLAQRLSMFGHRCWMCGAPSEQVDHVIAIARGGPHCLANLRPSCARCNQVKSDRDWRLFVSRREVA